MNTRAFETAGRAGWASQGTLGAGCPFPQHDPRTSIGSGFPRTRCPARGGQARRSRGRVKGQAAEGLVQRRASRAPASGKPGLRRLRLVEGKVVEWSFSLMVSCRTSGFRYVVCSARVSCPLTLPLSSRGIYAWSEHCCPRVALRTGHGEPQFPCLGCVHRIRQRFADITSLTATRIFTALPLQHPPLRYSPLEIMASLMSCRLCEKQEFM